MAYHLFSFLLFQDVATGVQQQNGVTPVSKGVSLSEGATVKASVESSAPKNRKGRFH